MKRLLLLLFPLVLLVALPGVVAHANVAVAFCDNGFVYCANRAGGGTGTGTPVIAYNKDKDNNEDFEASGVQYCNAAGQVTATCPLSPASLNTPYIGDPTVTIYSYDTGKCIGANTTYGTAILAACGNIQGQGGGTGTIYVQTGANYFINRWATNSAGAKRFLCDQGYRSQLTLIGAQATALCQWYPY